MHRFVLAPAETTSDRLTPYQRFVVFSAWLGLGFDLMDSILFNFISPLAVPDLLHLAIGAPETKAATGYYTGVLTSVMLFGWALGGVVFGRLSDRIGRTRTVVLTMLVFSLGTLACAASPNLAMFTVFRFIAALGIGGEWAAGATLVAETVPESRRVSMGALLFTSAPAGVFMAILLSRLFTSEIGAIARDPSLSWRVVMASGAAPAFVALLIRRKLREPESFGREAAARGSIRELFTPALRQRTLGGLMVGTVALITFWVSSAFLPMIATFLADEVVPRPSATDMPILRAAFVTRTMLSFNIGGLIGSLLAAPLAVRLGRRPLFYAYFTWSVVMLLVTFVPRWSPETRTLLVGLVSVSAYGVFGAFQFYLPELFPAHLRGTGAGFCLNAGRFLTVLGPLVVAYVAKNGVPVVDAMRYLAFVPAAGVAMLAVGLGVETQGQALDEP
jgi:MFS family permease